MTSTETISAIVSIYNERAALPGAIQTIDRFLADHFADYEIMIVESGSTDGTGEACDQLVRTLPKVRVHHEGRRNGFGSAVRAGVALATKQWVWPLVADMPFDLAVMDTAIPYLNTYDCVLSYRSIDPRARYRRFQSAVFNVLGRHLLGIRVRHINSAFKVIRTSLFQSLDLTSNGWLLDAELIMRLTQLHCRWVEIPVPLVDRRTGRSTIGVCAVARSILDLLRLACRRVAKSRTRL